MYDIVVHAKRARSRGIADEVPPAVAPALGCRERDVRIHVVELDQGGGGPFVVVYAPGPAAPDGIAAIRRAVGDAQGVDTEDVVVRWVTAS
jgi:hypothetical protein